MKYILQKSVLTEVKKMFIQILGLSAVQLFFFFIFGFFDKTAVLGTLLGVAVAFLNFLFLAVTVDFSVKRGKSSAQGLMGLSYSLRLLFIAAAVVFAIKSPAINYIATVIPLVFPRIIILINNLAGGKKRGAGA